MRRREDLPKDASHESLCRRCGVSCHLAIPVNGVAVTVPRLRCKHLRELERGAFTCSVYAERLVVAPWCHHADEAGPLGFLARDCPYALRDGWRTGKVSPGKAALAQIWPTLLAEIQRVGVPEWVDQAAFTAELDAREGPGVYTLAPDAAAPGRLTIVRSGAL